MSLIDDYLSFLNRCLTPYHVISESIKILKDHGYKKISINDLNTITPGKYYIIAFTTVIIPIIVPNNPAGVRMVATHNDSPVLKLKPNFSDTVENMSVVRLCTYGGGLWHTWFDRSLSVGGLVVLRDGRQVIVDRLFDVVVPSLPPHLNNSKVYNNGFLYDKERVLNGLVMVGTKLEDRVFRGRCGTEMDDKREFNEDARDKSHDSGVAECVINDKSHNSGIAECVISDDETTCQDGTEENAVYFKLEDVVSHNLSLYDLARAELLNEQLIMSARQDNLLSTFLGLKALNAEGQCIKVLAVFDFEETGSMQVNGARCTFLKDVYNRLQNKDPHNSMIISLDVTHAYNFNYDECYEKKHRVKFGGGVVVKHGPAYATDVHSSAFVKRLAEFKCQDYSLRNDIRGGGTIGTMLSTLLGVRCVDLGTPVMAMHSIREATTCKDVMDTFKLLYDFYKA
ncbi:Aminopeptidase I zinc metalloprotease (M18) [Trachipleistophora hominis]|uniref:aspartyl aminopeptidase n=1 Tax=Trachipleistophora hominis TaxID=72359 RepID=L7JYA6_TRAHO|nr:Aminopeptidase I zinc metalloprotease (M18) [Trachipleistophora hominis]